MHSILRNLVPQYSHFTFWVSLNRHIWGLEKWERKDCEIEKYSFVPEEAVYSFNDLDSFLQRNIYCCFIQSIPCCEETRETFVSLKSQWFKYMLDLEFKDGLGVSFYRYVICHRALHIALNGLLHLNESAAQLKSRKIK